VRFGDLVFVPHSGGRPSDELGVPVRSSIYLCDRHPFGAYHGVVVVLGSSTVLAVAERSGL
jgi:hypothetical protein